MNINDAAKNVLKVVESTTGDLDSQDRRKIEEAVVAAMRAAAAACGRENDATVAEHLKHDPTLVQRINDERDMRRKALISNLSAAR